MIYTSRNSFRLLNHECRGKVHNRSTQVEILLGYLTEDNSLETFLSTQVEILLGYLT